MALLTADSEHPTLEELRLHYTYQENLSKHPIEFIENMIIGANREIAAGEHIESNLRFLSVAQPLVAKL